MRHRPVRDVLSVFGTGERAYRADPMDEYRELTILAGAWERGSLEIGVGADGSPRNADEGKGKESALE